MTNDDADKVNSGDDEHDDEKDPTLPLRTLEVVESAAAAAAAVDMMMMGPIRR